MPLRINEISAENFLGSSMYDVVEKYRKWIGECRDYGYNLEIISVDHSYLPEMNEDFKYSILVTFKRLA